MLANRLMGALGEPPAMDVAESVGLTTAQTAEADLLSVTGTLRGADAWFQGPTAWMGAAEAVTLRLYARLAGARVKIAETPLASVERTDEGGITSALVHSVRGLEAEAYELTVSRSGAGTNLSGGKFVLRASSHAAPWVRLAQVAGCPFPCRMGQTRRGR